MRWLAPAGGEARYWWPHQLVSGDATGTLAAGRAVTPSSATGSAAVWACVRVLSESIATLPLQVFERLGRGRSLARSHPIYGLLHDAPNPRQTAVEWREQAMAALLLYGNAYAWLERWPSGRVRAIWPLRPDRVTVRMRVGTELEAVPELVYQYRREDGSVETYPADAILHVRGLSSDGLVGLSPIAVHREAVALELAEREFAARFFGNNARPGGVLKTAGKLSPEAAARLKASWEAAHRGNEQAHRVAVLEEGLEWQGTTMPLVDAQFLDQRRFSLEEIARIFRVPLHLVGDLTRATFANIEHQSLEFVIHSVRPWCVRVEQALNARLLFPDERADTYVEHALDGLLRGDLKARYDAYALARSWGWLSANDVRERENLNPVEGGDAYLRPMNYVDQAAPPEAPPAEAARAVAGLPGLTEGREALPPGHDGDAVAILRLAYASLGVPQMASAIRESLGGDDDGEPGAA